MAEVDNWIATGDRSHPTLKLVDELKEQLTYDGYMKDLQKLETAHLKGDDYDVKELTFYIQESNRIHGGDRSHPRLVELDSIRGTLTYDGWENDVDEALLVHKSNGEDDSFNKFRTCMKKMRRKQRMSIGDYRHPNLKVLFSLALTFPGWEDKLEEAVNEHRNGWDIDYFRYFLVERQRMFEGVRSHERLVALDALTLTYPDWEKDVKEIETNHLDNTIWYNDGVYSSYGEQLDVLEAKQRAYEAGDAQWKYHPIQKKILEGEWTYPGFEDDLDKIRAEDPTSTHSDFTFREWKERCSVSQMIHEGNFEDHEALVKLNELILSYPGWEQDFEEAKDHLMKHGYSLHVSFDYHINGMKNKQVVYDGSKKAEEDKKKAGNPSKHLGSCAICFENPQTHVFVPCGHVCACKQCSSRVMAKNKKCPICNKESKITMELFFC